MNDDEENPYLPYLQAHMDFVLEVAPEARIIEGGYHIKELDSGLCVDVMMMIFNWRVVRSEPDHFFLDRGWCYFGRDHFTLQIAAQAAAAWDGADDTDPDNWNKRVIPFAGKPAEVAKRP